MMTLKEQKLAVCGKLPELFYLVDNTMATCDITRANLILWMETTFCINWPTEGLQVCHEAEKLLTEKQRFQFYGLLLIVCEQSIATIGDVKNAIHATYEQRLEALCRVWFPEKFN